MDESMNRLRRLYTKTSTEYVIIPVTVDEFKVKMKEPMRNTILSTKYYGQHDWTIGSPQTTNTYYVDYRLDDLARLTHMFVVDSQSYNVDYSTSSYSGSFTKTDTARYNVHIYYWPLAKEFPVDWTVKHYFNSKPRL